MRPALPGLPSRATTPQRPVAAAPPIQPDDAQARPAARRRAAGQHESSRHRRRKASDWGSYYPSDNVVTAMDYLKEPIRSDDERTQVINLCRSYKYLGAGYYVSLLAEARGHKVIPSVRTINDLRRRSLYGLDIEDLNQKLAQALLAQDRDTTDFGMLVYFGETSYDAAAGLGAAGVRTVPLPDPAHRVRAREATGRSRRSSRPACTR
jgi:hypothetical protein